MGVPWKKIGKGLLKSIAVGAVFDPHMALLQGAIEAVERTTAGQAGTDKKATVDAISDAVLEAELFDLTPDQRAELRQVRGAWIDLYVALRNTKASIEALVAQEEAARARLMAVLATVRPPTA